MKKLNDLKAERGELVDKMTEVVEEIQELMEEVEKIEGEEEVDTVEENSQKTVSEKRSQWEGLNQTLQTLDETIAMMERQEEINKTKFNKMENIETRENTPIALEFRSMLEKSAKEKTTNIFEFRADPIITSTQTGIINKTVADGVDILTSPAEAFLRSLGVTFYPGLTGNFVVPAMAEDTAAFPGEDASAASANMAPEALTLAARRVTHTQSISRETLAQTNPAIYASILQNLVNGIWNAVTYDLFDQIDTDAATQIQNGTAAGLTYGDLVKMEASIGGLNIGAGAYVTTPTVKAYLKQKALLGTDNGPIWRDNEINGYPAYGVPAANSAKVYFGDFSKTCVGQWGGIEIVVDPLSDAKKGLINLTAIALVDTGCFNKRGINIIQNASTGF